MATAGQLDLLDPLGQDPVAQRSGSNQGVVLGPGEGDRRLDSLQLLDPARAHQRAGLVIGRRGHVRLGDRRRLAGTEALGPVDEPAESPAPAASRRHDRPKQRARQPARCVSRARRPGWRPRASASRSRRGRARPPRSRRPGGRTRSPSSRPGRSRRPRACRRSRGSHRSRARRSRGWPPSARRPRAAEGTSESGHVHCDHLALGRQPVHHRRPLDQRAAQGMQQEQRLPLPAPYEVQPSRRLRGPTARGHSSRSYST